MVVNNSSSCIPANSFDKTVWFDYIPLNDTCLKTQLIVRSPTLISFLIYNGTSCANLNCINEKVDNIEEFSWQAIGGVHYWFRIGVSPEAGRGTRDEISYALRLDVSLLFIVL